jgi:hypothetical protein
LPGSKDSLDKADTDFENAVAAELTAAGEFVDASQAELETEASCSAFAAG